MANIKISELPAAAAALAAMQLEVNDGGVSKRVTAQQVFEAVVGATGGLLARTGAGATTARTLLSTSSQLVITDGNGVAGAPSFALDIASQAEAEAGVATKLMTAQRVGQAIAAQVAAAGGGWATVETLYDFGVSGSVASALSSNLADGYDYRLVFDAVKGSTSGSAKFLTLQAYVDEESAWSPSVALSTSAMLEDATAKFSADLLLVAPRRARRAHSWQYMGEPIALDGNGRATTTTRDAGRDQSYTVTTTTYGPANVGSVTGTLMAGGALTYSKLGLIFSAARRIKQLRVAWSTGLLAGGTIKLQRQIAQN